MLQVDRASWRMIWPNAPSAVLDAFAAKSEVLRKGGVLENRTRLAYFCANVEHECMGFALRGLTENINYTAARMAQVWPNRFSSAGAVIARYGSAPGWQMKAFDDIYGNRMGNRPGTHDGSTYIGRAGPQVTGRDGYREVGKRCSRDFEADYKAISELELQPEVCVAFWSWKNLNKFADAGDFLGCVKSWNGGTNGLADRKSLMAGNNPVIARIQNVDAASQVIDAIPSAAPPVVQPTHDVRWIQNALNTLAAKGVIKLTVPLETRTGIYGTKTHDAVEVFQRKFGVLPYDGIAGTLTIPVIERELARAA